MLKLSYQGDVVKCRGLEKTIGLQDRILIREISSPLKGMGEYSKLFYSFSLSQHSIHLPPSASCYARSWHQDTTPEAETSEYLCTP